MCFFAGIFAKKAKSLMVVYNALMETMEKKTTAERVREIRKEKGLYQHEVAARARLSVQTVRNVEAGRHEPELPTLRKIAGALGVPLSELLA
jgi:DNA-binding XRE family transcriptional regulator